MDMSWEKKNTRNKNDIVIGPGSNDGLWRGLHVEGFGWTNISPVVNEKRDIIKPGRKVALQIKHIFK